MKKAFLVLSVALSLLSCDNSGPEPAQSPFLKVEVLAPYSGVDQWIFATNENGELMDAKRVEDGIELSTTTEYTSFDLSILNVDYYKREIFGLTTYRNFNQSEIMLRNSYYQPPSAKPAGQAKVTITGIPEDKIYQYISVSSSLYGESNVGNWTYSKNSFSVVKMLAKQSDKVVVATSKSGTPAYHIFDNVTDGDALTINYADLTPHQNMLTISPPGFPGSARIQGLADNDQSVFSLGSDEGSSSTPLQIGTVPGFTRFRTTISSYGTVYTKKGSALSSYATPQFSLNVTDTTISNFSASLSLAHDYQYAVWHRSGVTNGNTINWLNVYVYSDKSSAPTVNFEIPPAILREHPTLTLGKLKFDWTTFYRSQGTYSYSDFLAERFNGTFKSDYELYEFSGN